MLTQYDIDKIMQSIQNGDEPYLYYIANMIETRNGLMDTHIYKSSTKFKVIKVQVKDIKNAYFEYLDYLNDPDNFHIESEESYYEDGIKQIYNYVVANAKNSYEFDINPRMPSVIYGTNKEVYDEATNLFMNIDIAPPMDYEFTNTLIYGDNTYSQTLEDINNGKLDWKYRKLNSAALVDGVEYQYLTSNWYVLDIKNFPSIEMPLISTNKQNCYFTQLNDALNYMEQLIA